MHLFYQNNHHQAYIACLDGLLHLRQYILKIYVLYYQELIVGFNIDPEILIQIRKARIKHMGAGMGYDYIDVDKVKDELTAARRLYAENNWPTIDISRKSVEETATSIIQMLHKK